MNKIILALLGLAATSVPAHADTSRLTQYLLLQQLQNQQRQQAAPQYQPPPTWNCNHYPNSTLCQQTSPVYGGQVPTVRCNHYQYQTVCQ